MELSDGDEDYEMIIKHTFMDSFQFDITLGIFADYLLYSNMNDLIYCADTVSWSGWSFFIQWKLQVVLVAVDRFPFNVLLLLNISIPGCTVWYFPTTTTGSTGKGIMLHVLLAMTIGMVTGFLFRDRPRLFAVLNPATAWIIRLLLFLFYFRHIVCLVNSIYIL